MVTVHIGIRRRKKTLLRRRQVVYPSGRGFIIGCEKPISRDDPSDVVRQSAGVSIQLQSPFRLISAVHLPVPGTLLTYSQ